MQEVGKIIHIANSGRVIVHLTQLVQESQILCDEKSSKVAKVMELIGPVAKPYASATPLTNNIKKYTGKKVFALKTPAKKQKKLGRNKK